MPCIFVSNLSGTMVVIEYKNLFSLELCGSCYAFASSGMNEARLRIFSNNTLQPVFSPQDIVDCSPYSQGIYVLLNVSN